MGYNPKNESEAINMEASLPQNFGFEKMGLRAITSSINHNKNTMSTLYGNSQASADLENNIKTEAEILQDSTNSERVLLLVTWLQKDDPYWYGAKVPGKLISIESLKSNHALSERKVILYQLYDGKGNKNDVKDSSIRIESILTMKPALFPSK